MATTVKTVDVQIYDDQNKTTTYKIDNPKDGLTRTEVVAAFYTGINAELFITSNGKPVSVGTVTLSTSIKEVMAEDSIYITPSLINVTIYSQNVKITDVTVTGATIDNSAVSNIDWTSKPEIFTGVPQIKISSQTSTSLSLSWESPSEVSSGNYVGSTTLFIIINNKTFQVPININFTVS